MLWVEIKCEDTEGHKGRNVLKSVLNTIYS